MTYTPMPFTPANPYDPETAKSALEWQQGIRERVWALLADVHARLERSGRASERAVLMEMSEALDAILSDDLDNLRGWAETAIRQADAEAEDRAEMAHQQSVRSGYLAGLGVRTGGQ